MSQGRPKSTTLGALLEAGYSPREVREEIRVNLLARLSAGTRIFDVLLGGEVVLENYDMRAEAGFATADFYSFPVDVEDGILEIGFVRRIENPKFSAIEIERIEAE